MLRLEHHTAKKTFWLDFGIKFSHSSLASAIPNSNCLHPDTRIALRVFLKMPGCLELSINQNELKMKVYFKILRSNSTFET